ncbi:ethylene-responsive transcription factor RAP2-7-like isoform X4 [Gossypium australe]|uniref:Ethylene-responsive transcription factor RAP2-7-like isoform X4 n=1 Tax=Gossypium australe TaxID=47621 RepID=A0A5B6X8M5_9ROSI|nr:ethylene-responsive transcription factor RAP2-7-like isoform X4 [Gossypium australe]
MIGLHDLLLQAENPAAATVGPAYKGLAGTSDQPILWNSVYPRCFPSEVKKPHCTASGSLNLVQSFHHELIAMLQTRVLIVCERAMVRRVDIGPPQGPSNWTCQMRSQVSATATPLFSTAASSGFSYLATTPAAPKPINQMTQNLCFTSSTATATNTAEINFQMQPPP